MIQEDQNLSEVSVPSDVRRVQYVNVNFLQRVHKMLVCIISGTILKLLHVIILY